MWRCLGLELVSMGGGHVLAGSLRRGAGWLAAGVACVVVMWWLPVVVWALIAVRLSSIVEAARRGRQGPGARGWRWQPALLFVAVSVGFFAVVRSEVIGMYRVPSAAMAPTLRIGDVMLVDELSLAWRAPGRGDVVVYDAGHGRDFVGRIVAVGGDRVAVSGGLLFLGGEEVPWEPLGPITMVSGDLEQAVRMRAMARRETLGGRTYTVAHTHHHERLGDERTGDLPDEVEVPAGHVFILGDNRDNAVDSRELGAFPASAVRARVIGVWLGGIEGRFTNLGRIE